MATLYNVRTCAGVKYHTIAQVKALRAATPYGGHYRKAESDFVRPDYDAIREALPHYWRAAWDRQIENGSMWFASDDTGAYVRLYDSRRRKCLVTVYAEAYDFVPKG